MLQTLLESQHSAEQHRAETAVSLLIHATIVTLLLQISTQAAPEIQKAIAEHVTFAQVKKEAPPPPREPPAVQKVMEAAPVGSATPLPAKGFQVLRVPIGIPNALPPIDLSKAVTDEADFTGKGVAGGVARGVVGGVVMKDPPPVVGTPGEAPVYIQTQVEKLASARPDNPALEYPDVLRRSAIEGSVKVQFVVDTNGRAEMDGLKVLSSTHDLFTKAVREHLQMMRYYPAEIGGRRVRMLVEQPFTFTLVTQP